ncbi:MAG TPA: GDSL-type esterase/lipase family protein [Rariglobus sp.]
MKLLSFTRTVILSCLLAVSAGTVFADGPTPYPAQSDEASWPGAGPIRVGSWMNDNRAYFWTVRAQDQGAVVFVGDSQVGGWNGLGKAFPGIKVANRGIGGDVSRGVLFRLREDVLELNPRAIVFCMGTNDLSAHAATDDIIANISSIVDQARQAKADLPIVLCTIPPRNVPNAPIIPGSLESLNLRIKAFAAGKPRLAVLDLHAAFANPDGTINPQFIGKDGIHITSAAYEKWAALLQPVLKSLGIERTPAATP